MDELNAEIEHFEKDLIESENVGKYILDLRERVKELDCLYRLSGFASRDNICIDEMFKYVVDLIPPAWQYPDITCSRIVFDGKDFKTDDFKMTDWKLSSDIFFKDKKVGAIEVFYLEEKPQLFAGPFLKEEKKLLDVIAEQLKNIVEKKTTEEELHNRTHDMEERAKELNCLYGLSELAVQENISIEMIFKGMVYLIPPAWQYPEITCARIYFKGKEFLTENFVQTGLVQSSDIKMYEQKIGSIEVYYTEERINADEYPFLKEERNLLNALASRLGKIAERKHAEQALKDSELQLREQKKSLEQKNIALKEILAQIEIEKKGIKDNVADNVEKLLLPILRKLRLKGESVKYIDLLKKNLEDLASAFGSKISEKSYRLSPREIEICGMIRNGLTSKEISSLLYISLQTVEKHRAKIRNKLGISNTNYNLFSYLQKF